MSTAKRDGQADIPAFSLRVSVPSWLLSLLLHGTILLVLALTWRFAPKGLPGNADRTVLGEIVIAHHTPEGDYFETQDGVAKAQSEARSQQTLADALSEEAAAAPSVNLPRADIGLPSGSGTTGAGLSTLTGGAAQPRSGRPGSVKVQFMNVESVGSTFVFVIDRSASMDSPNRLPLNGAKSALKAALKQLNDTCQFQIVFYNDKPQVMTLQGARGGLLRADEQNLTLAFRFIDGIIADGATRHKEALLEALKLGPDVIYFLTDADQPAMSAAELAEVRRRNHGDTTIHAIEFGLSAYVREDKWLTRLPQQNGGGTYTYVNVQEFAKRP